MPAGSSAFDQGFGAGRTPLPELVALLSEPMHVGVEFVQGAVLHGLGVDLPIGESDSTEFVTGEFPIFFVQTAGRLLQLKFMPLPYFAEQCRPFVNGDPHALTRAIPTQELSSAVAEHQGWLAVSFMNPGAGSATAEAYEYVGKMMAALIIVSEAVALVWPAGGQIRPWDFELLESLENGDPLAIFR